VKKDKGEIIVCQLSESESHQIMFEKLNESN